MYRIFIYALTLLTFAAGVFAQQSVKENLGTAVNSPYIELLPIISADGRHLYFVRQDDPLNVGPEDHQDIWFSERLEYGNWSQARNLGAPLNTVYPDALISLSADGNSALVLGTYEADGSKGGGFSISHIAEEGWSFPKALDMKEFYNLSRYVSACMTNDRKTILMGLERLDGLGESDIYVSFLQSDGSWSTPLNLGSTVNTKGDDATPFLASDGISLYFSSDGHGGFGSNDMYVSKRLDSTWTRWSKPVNLGADINSPSWDAYYTIPASGEWAYFVSYEEGGEGSADIYRVLLPDSLRPKPVVLVKGTVKAPSGNPVDASISYGRLGTGKQMGQARSNPQNGEYSITFPFEEWYGQQDTIWYAFSFSKEGYLPVHKNLDLRKMKKEYGEVSLDVVLHPIYKAESAGSDSVQAPTEIVLENVFFDFDRAELQPESFDQLNFLADSVLARYPEIDVIISGHTDSVGTYNYNMQLSRERAEAIVAYLVGRGIAKHRVRAEWFGYTDPIASNSTEEGRQRNRRATFRVERRVAATDQ